MVRLLLERSSVVIALDLFRLGSAAVGWLAAVLGAGGLLAGPLVVLAHSKGQIGTVCPEAEHALALQRDAAENLLEQVDRLLVGLDAGLRDQNGADAPTQWPEFSQDVDKRLELDPSWQVLDNFRAQECAFWRKYYGAN